MSWTPKYKIGEEVYVFTTWDSYGIGQKIKLLDLMFLAKAKVLGYNKDKNLYLLELKEFLFDRMNMESIVEQWKEDGKIPSYHKVWVEDGERAYNVFSNPSLRLKWEKK